MKSIITIFVAYVMVFVVSAAFGLDYHDDAPVQAGKLAICEIMPSKAGNGKRYIRTGEAVTVRVCRYDGSKGDICGVLTAKLGTKWSERKELIWADKSTEVEKEFSFTPPPDVFAAAQTELIFSLSSTNADIVVSPNNNPFKVMVLAEDAPVFEQNEVVWSGVQYMVSDTNLVALRAFDGLAVKWLNKISGRVPKGLKVSLVDGQIVITGTPTVGARTTATFWVVLTRGNGSTVYSMPVTVTFESVTLADVNPGFTSARSWTGLPLVANGRLMGLLDMSVAKNGKTSARYRMVGGKSVAFASSGLAGVDADGTVTLGATKTVKNAGVSAEYVLSAKFGADGSLEASVTRDGGDAVVATIPAGADPWSVANTAERFGGNYVAAFPLADTNTVPAHPNTLCFGAASMRLKFNTESAWKRGVVTFAGTLPNGKAVSGTATLVPTVADVTNAPLPVFASISSDTFAAMVDLVEGSVAPQGLFAVDGVVPYWRHNESNIEELSYANDYDVIGAVWSWDAWKSAVVSGAKISGDAISGNINRVSGIAAGTRRMDVTGKGRLSTLQWKGVALPGALPGVVGAYWFNVTVEYDGGGIARKRTVRKGGSVAIPEECP